MDRDELKTAGFKDITRVDAARTQFLDTVERHGRTESIPVSDADGRAIAEPITATRPVPHYERAAMDGYAVRAADTFGATDRSPSILRTAEEMGPNRAVRVHTGSELPPSADAVVKIEDVESVGSDLEVFTALTEGENVGEIGEDVSADQRLYEPVHQLRPSDLGLIKSVGHSSLSVFERPQVAVIPTGEELVQSDPDPGEVIETNGQTVSQLVERWDAKASYRAVVPDTHEELSEAIHSDRDHDIIVTTGGSSVGERDLVPAVVDELGEVLIHGVALKPGHPVALGRIDSAPILMLPGYPVACIVNAVQFLRPVLKEVGGLPCPPLPTRHATLERKIASEPGTRTFARVRLEPGPAESPPDHRESGTETPTAVPTRSSGAGILSSVALADGWVIVPDDLEGYDAGETVAVHLWEWSP